MLIAKVVGLVVSTIKYDTLTGSKLLIVQETDINGKTIGMPTVAIDAVDAGEGDAVLVVQGSAARQTDFTRNQPVDSLIVGIIETLHVNNKVTFRKGV